MTRSRVVYEFFVGVHAGVSSAVGYGWAVETDKPAAAAGAQVKAPTGDDGAGRLSRALTTRVAPRLVALALGAACILMGLDAAGQRPAESVRLHGPTVSNGTTNPRTTHSHRQKLHRRPGSASLMKFR